MFAEVVAVRQAPFGETDGTALTLRLTDGELAPFESE